MAMLWFYLADKVKKKQMDELKKLDSMKKFDNFLKVLSYYHAKWFCASITTILFIKSRSI